MADAITLGEGLIIIDKRGSRHEVIRTMIGAVAEDSYGCCASELESSDSEAFRAIKNDANIMLTALGWPND